MEELSQRLIEVEYVLNKMDEKYKKKIPVFSPNPRAG